MARKRTPYDALGVPPNADATAIKRAHRKRARETHPDSGGSDDEFREVQSAYELVIDPARRRRYDETGDDGEPRAESEVNRLLAATFVQVVQQIIGQGVDPARKDCFAAMLTLFREKVKECDQQIGQNQDAKRKLQQVAKRIKKEPQPSLFASIVKGEMAKVDAMNASLASQKSTFEEAIRHVKACEYEVDNHPGFTFPTSGTGPVFWTSGS